MVSWREFEADDPEFAERVRALFQARKHKTMATLRADGSPRISGIETQIDDELTFGSMPQSRKLADLQRDPRLALHSPSVDPPPEDAGGLARRGEDRRTGGRVRRRVPRRHHGGCTHLPRRRSRDRVVASGPRTPPASPGLTRGAPALVLSHI